MTKLIFIGICILSLCMIGCNENEEYSTQKNPEYFSYYNNVNTEADFDSITEKINRDLDVLEKMKTFTSKNFLSDYTSKYGGERKNINDYYISYNIANDGVIVSEVQRVEKDQGTISYRIQSEDGNISTFSISDNGEIILFSDTRNFSYYRKNLNVVVEIEDGSFSIDIKTNNLDLTDDEIGNYIQKEYDLYKTNYFGTIGWTSS